MVLYEMVALERLGHRVEVFPLLKQSGAVRHAEAERFVANIREGGSTNIDGALKAGLAMIADDSRPNYLIFLTDGLPTAGETNELKIAENARSGNRSHVRVFSFGVGFDVNARLLDRLSGGNSGTSEYVRPDENLEAHVGAFYSKITRPAFEVALDVFQHAGLITKRHRYEDVVAAPPVA